MSLTRQTCEPFRDVSFTKFYDSLRSNAEKLRTFNGYATYLRDNDLQLYRKISAEIAQANASQTRYVKSKETASLLANLTAAQNGAEMMLYDFGMSSNTNRAAALDYGYRFSQIDPEKVMDLVVRDTTLSSTLHAEISCLVSAITELDTGSLTLSDKVKRWFVGAKIIGAESVGGVALATSLNEENNNIFVIKTPRGVDDFLHEIAAGLYVGNNVRKYVPNFMYTYGYMRCSPLVSLPDGKGKMAVNSYCSTGEGPVSYSITENIRNAVPMGDFVLNSTEIELEIALRQIFNALLVANGRYGFTHYDMHAGNILVRRFDSNVAVPIYGSRDYTRPIGDLHTSIVAYIIDYGNCRYSLKSESSSISLGKLGEGDGSGARTWTDFPMFDLYKHLLFLAFILLTSTKYPVENAREILADDRNRSTEKTAFSAFLKRYFGNDIARNCRILQKFFDFFGEGNIVYRCAPRAVGAKDYYLLEENRIITIPHTGVQKKAIDVKWSDFLDWVEKERAPKFDGMPQPSIWGEERKYDNCRFFEKTQRDVPARGDIFATCEALTAVGLELQTEDPKRLSLAKDKLASITNGFDLNRILRGYATSEKAAFDDLSIYSSNRVPDIPVLLDPAEFTIVPGMPQGAVDLIYAKERSYVDILTNLMVLHSGFRDRRGFIAAVQCVKGKGAIVTDPKAQKVLTELVEKFNEWNIFFKERKRILENNYAVGRAITFTVGTEKENRARRRFWTSDHLAIIRAL